MNDMVFFESSLKMPLMPLPVRTPLITLSGGKVLLSPGSRLQADQYRKMDGVTDIVAPNLFHCAGVPKAAQKLPQAKLWVVQGGLSAKPDIKWSAEMTEKNWPYMEELPYVAIGGMPAFNEAVFVHKKSRSLLVTDLCFNMQDVHGFGPWLILSLFGTYRKLGVSRFFLKYVKDRAAFTKSLEVLFSYDFDNIIVSHGDNLTGGGRGQLLKAFQERGINL